MERNPYRRERDVNGNFFSRFAHSTVPQLGYGIKQAGMAYAVSQAGDPRRPGYSQMLNQLKASAPPGTDFRNIDLTKKGRWAFLNPNMQSVYRPAGPSPLLSSLMLDPIVQTGQRGANPNLGILAHEIGHAKQYAPGGTPLLNKMAGVGRGAVGLGLHTLPLLFADKESTAQLFTGLGTAASLPLLGQELDASWKGRNLLKEAASKTGSKLGFLQSLSPFKGIPSYMLATALPYIMYKYLKGKGQYEKDK